jgi:hypothetical protein
MSIEHLWEIGVGEPNDDVISGLRCLLAAKFKFSQNTREPSWIDINVKELTSLNLVLRTPNDTSKILGKLSWYA